MREDPGRTAASRIGSLAPWLRSLTATEARWTSPPRLHAGVPFVGNVFAMARDRLALMDLAGGVRGGVCEIRFPAGSVVVVSSPDLAHEVLVGKADRFVKGTTFRFLRPIIGDGLLTSEGEQHLRQRRLMAPAFAHRRIASYASTMAGYTERAQQGWADGARLDLAAEMMRLTLAIASKTLLDADIEGDAASVGDAVSVLIREVNRRISTPLSFLLPAASRDRRARDAIAALDAIILRIIRERRASRIDTGDLLSMLLSAQEEGGGGGMTDRQVRDETMTIFLAGHETTANALAWSFYLLARHPDAYARLRAEALGVLGGRAPSAEDLPRLPYALQVFKEALRLYPPAYLTSRLALEDVEIGGHRVRAGTDVVVNIIGMHRRPEYFADPQRFDPDRFEPSAEKTIPRGAYIPFGAGARVCIGNGFALMEGQIVLADLAQRVELSLESDREIPPEPLVTLRPAGGVPMRVRRIEPVRAVAE
jgi:cytochrome P450